MSPTADGCPSRAARNDAGAARGFRFWLALTRASVLGLALLNACGVAAAFASAIETDAAGVVWKDNDRFPIREPREDEAEKYQWWHDANSMSFYQAGKVLDLGNALHAVGESLRLVGADEARNVNAVDEVADSTWFTNRHGRAPLSPTELERGPNRAPPADAGALIVESGKPGGELPGFIVKDAKGDRYLVKLDVADFPEMASGAEQVVSKIVYALGWHIPEYHLLLLEPARLELAPHATTKTKYGDKRPLTQADVDVALAAAARQADGRVRASASRMLRGKPKGPFRFTGTREDDANDTVPHEHRRDLRGFRMVAAWVNHTDFRPANTLDMFEAAAGSERGYLMHYLLDFSSTLGSADLQWKAPKLGYEYTLNPLVIAKNLASFGFWVKPWEDAELTHRTLGYVDAATFDPKHWVTEFPNPIFDKATVRDEFWGAKLVTSLTHEQLRRIVDSGQWSDASAADKLLDILWERRQRIAQRCFDSARINPVDRPHLAADGLRFDDRAVEAGVVDAAAARYRYRVSGSDWSESALPHVAGPLPRNASFALQTSHDHGRSWSPTTTVTIAGGMVVQIARDTR